MFLDNRMKQTLGELVYFYIFRKSYFLCINLLNKTYKTVMSFKNHESMQCRLAVCFHFINKFLPRPRAKKKSLTLKQTCVLIQHV